MENILLYDAGVGLGAVGQLAAEEGGHGPLYPDVGGEGLYAPRAEEQGAVGHLGAHALYLHECIPGLLQRHFGKGGEVDLPFRHLFGGIQYVFGPEAGPQTGERRYRQAGQPFGRGEGVQPDAIRPLQRGAENGAEPLDNALDAGDVVVLGDNKGAEDVYKRQRRGWNQRAASA